jgi:uncharacterized membrane protein
MCIEPERFTIDGTTECWENGKKAANFYEVDTNSEVNWTMFLAEPAP